MTIHYYCPLRRAYITATVPTELAFKLIWGGYETKIHKDDRRHPLHDGNRA